MTGETPVCDSFSSRELVCRFTYVDAVWIAYESVSAWIYIFSEILKIKQEDKGYFEHITEHVKCQFPHNAKST